MLLPICLYLGLTLSQPTILNIKNFQEKIGCRINNLSLYVSVDNNFKLDIIRLNNLISYGIKPTLYIQPINELSNLKNTANGKYDSFYKKLSIDISKLNSSINVSYLPEVAEWQTYKISKTNTVEQYRLAFNRFAGIIKKTAPKVQIHWTVNVRFIGDYGKYETYYPGDTLVDYVTLTGFDFHKTNKWSQPRHFYEVFKDSYDEITLLTNKDVIVSETSTAGMGEYKTVWWNNAFADICLNFPKIKRITLFNILEVRKTWTANWKIDPLNLKGIFNKGNPCIKQ